MAEYHIQEFSPVLGCGRTIIRKRADAAEIAFEKLVQAAITSEAARDTQSGWNAFNDLAAAIDAFRRKRSGQLTWHGRTFLVEQVA